MGRAYTWSSLSVPIYGVQSGANYQDFQKNISKHTQSTTKQFKKSEFIDTAAVYIDPHTPEIYNYCLLNQVFQTDGLHAAIWAATEKDITIVVRWFVPGKPNDATVRWDPQVIGGKRLDETFPQCSSPGCFMRIPRPTEVVTLVGQGTNQSKGYSVTPIELHPWVPPPPEPSEAPATKAERCNLNGTWAMIVDPDHVGPRGERARYGTVRKCIARQLIHREAQQRSRQSSPMFTNGKFIAEHKGNRQRRLQETRIAQSRLHGQLV